MSKPLLYLADDDPMGFWAANQEQWTGDSRFAETFTFPGLNPTSREDLLHHARIKRDEGAVIHLVTDAQFVFEGYTESDNAELGGERLALEFVQGSDSNRAVIYSEMPRVRKENPRIRSLKKRGRASEPFSDHEMAFRFFLEGSWLPVQEFMDFVQRVASLQHLFDSKNYAVQNHIKTVFTALAAGLGENTAPFFDRRTYDFFDAGIFDCLRDALNRQTADRDWGRVKRILHPYESLDLAARLGSPFDSGGALRLLWELSQPEEAACLDRTRIAATHGFWPRENEWIYRKIQDMAAQRTAWKSLSAQRMLPTVIHAACSDLAFLGTIVNELNERMN
jgi:hypothetical protein